MEQPLISIIVPVYNTEQYLDKCVDSIVNQTYTNLEIILIDDGSPDNCGDICDEWAKKDSRIKVIHKPNGGLSSARNAGLDNSTGEYIGFIDSDDVIEPEMYEKMLKNIQNTHADVCMCGCKIINEQGELLLENNFSNKVYNIDEIIEEIILPLKTAVWDKLYKKELIGLIRFLQGRIHGEDLLFTLNLLANDLSISAISGAYYRYIKHPSSITTSKFSNRSFDEVYCKDQAYKIIEEKFPIYKEKARVWCFRARMNVMRHIYKEKEIKEYSQELIQYKKYVIDNYKTIKNQLRTKERIEFFVFKNLPILHRLIVKVCR